MKQVIAVVLLLLIPIISSARVPLEKYENTPGVEDMMTYYIQGVGQGFAYANDFLEANKKKRLFCQPASSGIKYKEILDMGIRDRNYIDEMKKIISIEFILFETLRNFYPCPDDSIKPKKKK